MSDWGDEPLTTCQLAMQILIASSDPDIFELTAEEIAFAQEHLAHCNKCQQLYKFILEEQRKVAIARKEGDCFLEVPDFVKPEEDSEEEDPDEGSNEGPKGLKN
jgi:hypothetical protein